MSQILDSLPPHHSNSILCSYINVSSRIQIARITNIPNWYFERVLFEATADAQLEIHTGTIASAILSDRIPCHALRVSDTDTTEIQEAGKQRYSS